MGSDEAESLGHLQGLSRLEQTGSHPPAAEKAIDLTQGQFRTTRLAAEMKYGVKLSPEYLSGHG